MKVKTKMISLFTAQIVFSLLFTAFFIFSISRMSTIVEKKLAIEQNVTMLVDRYIDHLLWGQKLSQEILTSLHTPVTVQVDHTKCAFGQWYYAREWETQLSGDPEMFRLVESLEIPHMQLHTTAKNILSMQLSTQYDGIVNEYTTKTMPLLATLGGIFTTIQTTGNLQNEEKMKEFFGIEKISNLLSVFSGILLVSMSLFAAISLFFVLNSLADVISVSAALGKGDFSITIDPKNLKRKDEIGEMLQSNDMMIRNVRDVISTVKEISDNLLQSGLTLSANAEETHGQVNSIVKQVQTVTGKTAEQADSVTTASTSVSDIVKNISQLDRSIENQASALIQSSASIEEMMGNISSINHNISKVSNEFDNLVAASENGKQKLHSVEKEIHEIAELSEALTETNKLIASISSQTNLLAMNAAIESAHAGIAGQGFAVVADEIRKLAEKSSVQSKEVAKQLKEIRTGVSSIVSSSGDTRVAFDTIAEEIQKTNMLVEELNSAVAEQATGSRQILESIKAINTITEEVKTSASEMHKGSRVVLDEMQDLSQISNHVASRMGEVESGTAEIRMASQNVLSIATSTKELIQKIDSALTKFKV